MGFIGFPLRDFPAAPSEVSELGVSSTTPFSPAVSLVSPYISVGLVAVSVVGMVVASVVGAEVGIVVSRGGGMMVVGVVVFAALFEHPQPTKNAQHSASARAKVQYFFISLLSLY